MPAPMPAFDLSPEQEKQIRRLSGMVERYINKCKNPEIGMLRSSLTVIFGSGPIVRQSVKLCRAFNFPVNKSLYRQLSRIHEITRSNGSDAADRMGPVLEDIKRLDELFIENYRQDNPVNKHGGTKPIPLAGVIVKSLKQFKQKN